VRCQDFLDRVEAMAAGDLPLDGIARAHVESCPACASALASARRLESMLAAVEVPSTPVAFTVHVLQRIRRERWRSEQNVDRLFNVAVASAVLLVAGGIFTMLNVDMVLTLSGSAWVVLRDGTRTALKEAAPFIGTYIAAAGLLASGLGMWWWAERKLQY
jgi:hypothetical protein